MGRGAQAWPQVHEGMVEPRAQAWAQVHEGIVVHPLGRVVQGLVVHPRQAGNYGGKVGRVGAEAVAGIPLSQGRPYSTLRPSRPVTEVHLPVSCSLAPPPRLTPPPPPLPPSLPPSLPCPALPPAPPPPPPVSCSRLLPVSQIAPRGCDPSKPPPLLVPGAKVLSLVLLEQRQQSKMRHLNLSMHVAFRAALHRVGRWVGGWWFVFGWLVG